MVVTAACLSVAAAAPPAAPCYGRLNATFRFEEPCFEVLHNGTGGLSLREYPAAEAARGGVSLVAYNASASITTYQEALEMTGYYVIEYFVGPGNARNESLLASRTVPLALRPPTPEHNEWLGWMALAPSKWPAGKTPPAPTYGIELLPLGMGAAAADPLLVAVLRVSSSESPQPSDFDAACAKLEAGVAAQLPGYAVSKASPFTPTHARYFGYEFYEGPFDFECWVGVVKK